MLIASWGEPDHKVALRFATQANDIAFRRIEVVYITGKNLKRDNK